MCTKPESKGKTKDKLKDTSKEHKKHAKISAGFAIITLSNTRTLKEDTSGDLIQEIAENNNHKVLFRKVIPDSKAVLEKTIRELLKNKEAQVIVTNGGTGLASTDITIETLAPKFEKDIPGFSALFWLLGYEQAKSATMLSRAAAGTISGKVVFCLPGSPRACKMAVEELIIPEIGHILKHAKK
ncbi:MAG: MogA/MoaB family molybdenum cofactor biosynthesis protein [Nanoarchaeota archaeon]|nr:MogA/MoaB family molybdenum cofactor biosynthesis protein [Nanoarchaeota archaeon]MBU1321939.1 MogA/MoaB family molybdenum cofactor biosynthesis protein [Nanoarchaeota archaeon]MBU1597935.1 MogA/MoaB family molybdenum cofactor biosynthesis protein [Nanoarchaeota archaeon]MBU2441143.1 MogA/MoaB family molybdenum cofactor biosynthesis protein [Nanoarchaeota archaeon]